MKKSKNRQRSLRKKNLSFESDEPEDEEGGLNLAPASVIAAQKQRQKSNTLREKHAASGYSKPEALLNERGEDSDPKIKEKQARKVLNVGLPSHAPPVVTGHQSRVTGEYTVEKLRELQQLTKRKPDYVSLKNGTTEEYDLGHPRISQAHDEEMMDVDVSDFGNGIPDLEAVRRAKESRARMRSGNGTGKRHEEFIPLSKGFPKAEIMQRSKTREIQRAIDRMEIEPEDEVDEWTQDQIQKGMRSGVVVPMQQSNESRRRNFVLNANARMAVRGQQVDESISGIQFDGEAAVKEIMEKMANTLNSLRLSREQNSKNLDRTEENLAGCNIQIDQDSELLGRLGDEFVSAQKMRGYISALCKMLSEKSGVVEQLQEELLSSRMIRAEKMSNKMSLTIKEEYITAEAGIKAALESIAAGQNAAEIQQAAKKAVNEAEQKLYSGEHIEVKLDEFGRDINSTTRASITDRVKKHMKTLASFEDENNASPNSSQLLCVDNATTSEDEGDVSCNLSREKEILYESSILFKDADDKFSTLSAVKGELEGWKASCPTQYNCTYMGMSAPALFAPFVRLEMLSWNPLDINYPLPSQQQWYLCLFEYGIHSPDDDDDHKVVPKLMSDVILPYLIDTVEKIWNPLSLSQSYALYNSIDDVLVYLDPSNADVLGMMNMIAMRLTQVILECQVPSWPTSAMDACRRAQVIVNKSYAKALRIIKNMIMFRRFIPSSEFNELLAEKIMKQRVLPALQLFIHKPITLCEMASRLLDQSNGGDILRYIREDDALKNAFIGTISNALDSDQRSSSNAKLADLVTLVQQET